MKRRKFLFAGLSLLVTPIIPRHTHAKPAHQENMNIKKLELSDNEWKKRLTPEQYFILREEGTERPFSSLLNDEKRTGIYACAGCDLPLFTSEMKYDSGTGWPSFYDFISGRLETKIDFKMILPRTEYHCAQCEGHHGHVFKDGPAPTKKRYCNNGDALIFIESNKD
ncbi:MAG: peptide-methionine (R)-S-oxide reductase MsrB [Gammaproteobacteria bacterium]|nr:peptide-methionine (R)-S-oxide reductase MsrB [Gammaproteobacteria bacterium]